MPTQDKAQTGAPCWIDIYTSDVDGARAFYGQLFGWTAEEPRAEFGGYFNFQKDGVRVAGGMPNDGSGGPDAWSVYLITDNADATAEKAVANAGTVVVPPMQIPGEGTMAVVTDPGGAAIGMWQPAEFAGFGGLGEPNKPGWFELHTRDYDKSVEFYRNVFGWNTHTASDEADFRYTTLGEGDDQAAGIMDATAFHPADAPASWSVYFAVESTDAALAKIVELGGAVVQPAEDTPYGRLASATDPTGVLFKLLGPAG